MWPLEGASCTWRVRAALSSCLQARLALEDGFDPLMVVVRPGCWNSGMYLTRIRFLWCCGIEPRTSCIFRKYNSSRATPSGPWPAFRSHAGGAHAEDMGLTTSERESQSWRTSDEPGSGYPARVRGFRVIESSSGNKKKGSLHFGGQFGPWSGLNDDPTLNKTKQNTH